MRLTERIKYKSTHPDERETLNHNREISSILNYLQKILNTRQGSVQIAEDFGIPDFTNIPGSQLSEMAIIMEKDIVSVLKKYEPRLKNVQVTFEADQYDILTVSFRLDATLALFEDVPVQFETVLGSNGLVKVTA